MGKLSILFAENLVGEKKIKILDFQEEHQEVGEAEICIGREILLVLERIHRNKIDVILLRV
jgi:hypothetical protein